MKRRFHVELEIEFDIEGEPDTRDASRIVAGAIESVLRFENDARLVDITVVESEAQPL